MAEGNWKKEIGEAIADTAENKEDREKQRGIEIVDMLAAEGGDIQRSIFDLKVGRL